jgi:hypothetical protein
MGRAVLQWPGRSEARAGWTNAELAELYRVEHALKQAAFAVETDHGVSDEGDPWFVFCHPDGQVVVHIARIDGLYHLFCLTLPEPLTGSSFVALTKTYVSTLPRPQAISRTGAVVAHPSALLSLLVAAAMFSVDALVQHPAHAAEASGSHGDLSIDRVARPAATKEAIVKVFGEAFAAAVWRGHAAEATEVRGSWQAVEEAALGFSALYEADLATVVATPAAMDAPATPLLNVFARSKGRREPARPALLRRGPRSTVRMRGARPAWSARAGT